MSLRAKAFLKAGECTGCVSVASQASLGQTKIDGLMGSDATLEVDLKTSTSTQAEETCGLRDIRG